MIRDWRLIVCAAVSIGGHLVFARGLQRLPPPRQPALRRVVSVRVVAPPPRDPPPEPPHPLPVARPVPHERPRLRPAPTVAPAAPPQEVPPAEPTPAPSSTPVFGVTMESTSRSGSGPAMAVGSSAAPPAAHAGSPPAAGPAAPVAAYEVTTMPLPQGRCVGQYTEEAKRAAIEGTVVLDLVVSEDGRVREVRVVNGLSHGLTDAAVAAARACRFSPGEKDGTPVPVRVRGFKIRFVLQSNE